MHEHRPAAGVGWYRLDPAFPGQFDEGNRLQDGFGIFAEEGSIGPLACAVSRVAEALQEGGNRCGGIGLEHEVQIPNVDPKLQG